MTPSLIKKSLSKPQRIVLWHMCNGWTLLVGNTGRLILCGPKFEIKTVRRSTRRFLINWNIIRVARTSDISYELTDTGRELAKTINEEDL